MTVKRIGAWALWCLNSFECQPIAVGIFNQSVSYIVPHSLHSNFLLQMADIPKLVVNSILGGADRGDPIWPLIPSQYEPPAAQHEVAVKECML
jgi:hypothetical protein